MYVNLNVTVIFHPIAFSLYSVISTERREKAPTNQTQSFKSMSHPVADSQKISPFSLSLFLPLLLPKIDPDLDLNKTKLGDQYRPSRQTVWDASAGQSTPVYSAAGVLRDNSLL